MRNKVLFLSAYLSPVKDPLLSEIVAMRISGNKKFISDYSVPHLGISKHAHPLTHKLDVKVVQNYFFLLPPPLRD